MKHDIQPPAKKGTAFRKIIRLGLFVGALYAVKKILTANKIKKS